MDILALLRVTKAYRTTSHEAVQVLAGGITLDLLLREDVIKYNIKRRGVEAAPDEIRDRMAEEPRK